MGLIGNIKRTNLCIMGAPEGEEKEKRSGTFIKEIMAESSLSLGK